MQQNINHIGENQEQDRYVTCRANDILKLMRTKIDRINIAKENSNT